MAKKKSDTKRISNRRARFDYELGDVLVAGISLSGKETKSLRFGHGHLKGAYVAIKNNEAWLINATINGSSGIILSEQEQTRDRKLLLKKRELDNLAEAKQQGKTIVPLELLTRGRYIKLKIAVGRGRKKYDKRQVIKKRETQRDVQASLKKLK